MKDADNKQIYITMMKLRKDAYQLGFREAVTAYGLSAIRAGNALLVELGEKPIQ